MNNQITLKQWNELMSLVKTSAVTEGQIKGANCSGTNQFENGMQRHYCCDLLERFDVPTLYLMLQKDSDVGTLTVYNRSEQARAPITLEQGILIATNFFNEYGAQISKQIIKTLTCK